VVDYKGVILTVSRMGEFPDEGRKKEPNALRMMVSKHGGILVLDHKVSSRSAVGGRKKRTTGGMVKHDSPHSEDTWGSRVKLSETLSRKWV